MATYNGPEDPINKKSEPFAFTGEATPTDPHLLDVDESYDSLHHTIGAGPTQAAPGNHKHKVKDLIDLVDPPKTDGTGASGTWPIAITGDAGSVDGQNFSWNDPGTWPTYLWVADSNGSAFLLAGAKVPRVFTGATIPSGQKAGDIWAY